MKRIIHYGAVLFIISAIAAALLSNINRVTAPQIAKITAALIKEARTTVLPKAVKFDKTKQIERNKEIFIPGYDKNKKILGYVTTIKSNGYSGIITFLLGIDLKGTITGLKVISQTETPGLGTNIEKPKWQALWIGRTESYKFNKSVDAFAGATISPKAVYTGVIKTMKVFNSEVKK